LARHDLMLQAFGKKGLTKNQEIISKEKVMNSRVVSVYLETFNVTKACFFKHQSREHLRTHDKKERGKRIPLPNPLAREIIPNRIPFMRMEKEEKEM
jgi:hypothetical protein